MPTSTPADRGTTDLRTALAVLWRRRAIVIPATAAAILLAGLASQPFARHASTGTGGRCHPDQAQHIVAATDRATRLQAQISAQHERLTAVIISIQRTKTALTQTNAQLANQPGALSLRPAQPSPLTLALAQTRTTLIVRIRALDDERAQTLAVLARLDRELDRTRCELASEHPATSARRR